MRFAFPKKSTSSNDRRDKSKCGPNLSVCSSDKNVKSKIPCLKEISRKTGRVLNPGPGPRQQESPTTQRWRRLRNATHFPRQGNDNSICFAGDAHNAAPASLPLPPRPSIISLRLTSKTKRAALNAPQQTAFRTRRLCVTTAAAVTSLLLSAPKKKSTHAPAYGHHAPRACACRLPFFRFSSCKKKKQKN